MRTCYAVLVLAGLAAGLAGCQSPPPSGRTHASSIPLLDTASTAAAGLSAEQVREAARLYTGKCVRCHKSYNPASYTETQWRTWMSKMSRKARLTPEQEELLSRYLEAVRTAPRADEQRAQ